jgi:hypothetical protein
LAIAAVATLAGGPATAGTTVQLVDGGGWQEFFFDTPTFQPDFQDLSGNTITYAFTLTSTDVLRVTDGFNQGDQFEVSIFNPATGFDIEPTSAASFGFANVGDCWTCAFFDPNYNSLYSSAAFILGPGTYFVSGAVIATDFPPGAGAIELGAVPEPAVWTMMMIGFFGLGTAMRRARRVRSAATV